MGELSPGLSEAAVGDANWGITEGLSRDGPGHWTDLGGIVGVLQIEALSSTSIGIGKGFPAQSRGELKYLWKSYF